MGLPRITYNSRNLDFLDPATRIDWQPVHMVNYNDPVSGAGREVLNRRLDIFVQLFFEFVTDSRRRPDNDFRAEIHRLTTWAQQGNAFTYANDRDKTVSTTLSADAAAGATQVTLTSVASLVNNDRYVIRDDTKMALVKITSTSNPVQITPALDFAFSSGATFRAEKYWSLKLLPIMLGPQAQRMVVDVPPVHWSFQLMAMEART